MEPAAPSLSLGPSPSLRRSLRLSAGLSLALTLALTLKVPMPKPTAAAVDNTLVLSVLRALPSFVSVDQGEPSPDGSFVSEEDEAIGCVYLAHREKVQLDRDIARVAELEMAA
mmetsp:Transcript_20229/g.61408  ORF Transcript_20229/g.61408 Transcript_20229/m.61408 type:complete len:113 (-) Transcript_20229:178-516(-)